MYLEYYHLKEKPFQINMDPKFIWLGERYQETLAVLKFGVLDNRGDLLVTGDAGSGKSTLIHELVKRFDRNTIVAKIDNPVMEKQAFLKCLADKFHMGKKFGDKRDFLIHFNKFLNTACSENKKTILIIDNAHQLNSKILKLIRRLSNIKNQNSQPLKIVFVGRNECMDIFSKRRNRILKQKITINYAIHPLKGSEICQYVFHRLQAAGSIKNIFTSGAIGEILSFSKGYPRLINIICDHALLEGHLKGEKRINAKMIKECIDKLNLRNETFDKDEKVSETPGVSRHAVVKTPWKKFSKKKVVFAVLSTTALIVLFYHPAEFGNPIHKMDEFIKKNAVTPSEPPVTDTPQMEISNPAVSPETPETQNSLKRTSGGSPKKPNIVPLTPAIYTPAEKKSTDESTAPPFVEKSGKNTSGKDMIQHRPYVVYLHYSNINNKALMKKLSVFLEKNGFEILGIEKVSYQNQDIRYFYDQDKKGALLLKKRLTQFNALFIHRKDIKINIINLTHKYPNAQKGALELWLNV